MQEEIRAAKGEIGDEIRYEPYKVFIRADGGDRLQFRCRDNESRAAHHSEQWTASDGRDHRRYPHR